MGMSNLADHEQSFRAMRQSIIEGAPETARELAQNALQNSISLLDAIDRGFVPGMSYVGEQFGLRAMFLPDMMAAAEAMKAARM